MFGTRGHIGRGITFLGEVGVIFPIGIVGITVWGIRLWLFIDLRHWHVLTSNPSLRENSDSVLLDGQWTDNCCMG